MFDRKYQANFVFFTYFFSPRGVGLLRGGWTSM
jgi:hypothetical protein